MNCKHLLALEAVDEIEHLVELRVVRLLGEGNLVEDRGERCVGEDSADEVLHGDRAARASRKVKETLEKEQNHRGLVHIAAV